MIPIPFWPVALVHLLLAVVSTNANQAPGTISDEQLAIWKSLCENDAQLELKQSSQIRALAQTLDTYLNQPEANSECYHRVAPALDDLNQLIEENKDDVCSLEAVARISAYFATYVSLHQDRNNDQQLPQALNNFFLAYGLQVNKICKINMIPTVEESFKQMLSRPPVEPEAGNMGEKFREYSALMDGVLSEEGPIGRLIKTPIDYDDLLLPRDIQQLVGEEFGIVDEQDEESKRIYMQTMSIDTIRVFKAICERQYKPIYKHILPLLYLSNIGFNYQGDLLKKELEELQSNELIRRTYRIAFLCETIESVVLVEDPKFSKENSALQSAAMMRILSQAEAEELQRENAERNNDDEDDRHKETRQLIRAIKEFVNNESDYKVQVSDEIFDDSDEDLKKLVRSFSAHKRELDYIKSKFIRKLKKDLISSLLQRKFIVAISQFADLNSRDYLSDHATLDNRQLISVIDERVDEVYNQEEAVSAKASNFEVFNGFSKRVWYKQKNMRKKGGYKKTLRKQLKKTTGSKGIWYALAGTMFILGCMAACTSVAAG